MASKSKTPAASMEDELWNRCLEKPAGTVLYQQELVDMGVTNNMEELVLLLQALVDGGKMQMMTWDGTVCWKTRSPEETGVLEKLNTDERLVYSRIEEAGNEGIWIKTLQARTNLHIASVNKAIKTMETKKLIRQIKSAKYPGKKMYMLFYLTPSEESTGGPWFSEGELDVDFIELLSGVVHQHIEMHSWVEARKMHKKKAGGRGTEAKEPRYKPLVGLKNQYLIAHSSEYKSYPTTRQIADFLTDSGVVEGVNLLEADVQQLLEVLIWDGKIEAAPGGGYRSTRKVEGEIEGNGPGNGLTEAPCGRCPVFTLCEEGGPVNAANCEYFQAWLDY